MVTRSVAGGFPNSNVDLQNPFDVAVVVPTILRPSLKRTLRSIFSQDFPGRIQILLGIDIKKNDAAVIDDACRQIPNNCAVCVLDLGYSTSTRHGGLHPAADGGALRTIMSYAANSRYPAYLDDDNWWAPQHLASLRRAIEGFHWAFSYDDCPAGIGFSARLQVAKSSKIQPFLMVS